MNHCHYNMDNDIHNSTAYKPYIETLKVHYANIESALWRKNVLC